MSNSKVNLPLQFIATTAAVLLILLGLYWGGRYLFYEPVEKASPVAGKLPVAVAECEKIHTDMLEIIMNTEQGSEMVCGLDLSGHINEELKRVISTFDKLVILKANDNLLKSIPTWIGDLRLLRVLELRNNQINAVPEEIGELGALEVLDLRGNPLSPPEIERVRALVPQAEVLF